MKTPRILQINFSDMTGGAAKVGFDLFQGYRSRGYSSYLAVGQKESDNPNVFVIPNEEHYSAWRRFWQRVERFFVQQHHSGVAQIFAALARTKPYLATTLGRENFYFPGSYDVLKLPPEPPDIMHAHNLHGGYFDLRALPWLSRQRPFMITMHDAWLLSGHCAHSFDCERWLTGCGQCPDLKIYPALKRDATAYNWRRKQQIYSMSQLYIAAPSQWLKKKAEKSMLAPAIRESRLIPYGVDLKVFKARDQQQARLAVNLPPDRPVVLTRANSLRQQSPWMDFRLTRTVVDALVAGSHEIPLTIVALGEDRPSEYFGGSEIRYIPHQADYQALVPYYQAADLLIHGSRVDTFPLTVLEALACETPVVATSVGGIPEQITDGVTGFVTPAGDAQAMIRAVLRLLTDLNLCRHMGKNASEAARKRFDHERQVSDYLNWYQEILAKQPHSVDG